MRVSIIKEKRVQNTILPNDVIGSFWIVDTDKNGIKRNLISIEADNGRWKLISNKDVIVVQNNIKVDYVYLQNGGFYYIKNLIQNITYLIYVSDILTTYNQYIIDSLLNNGLYIGNNEQCHIKYSILSNISCFIKRENKDIYITDNESKFGIYINNVRLRGKKVLKNGDVIFIVGLKIIFININDNNNSNYYLFVNIKNNINVNLNLINIPVVSNIAYEEENEENEYPLYDEKEYFHKKPRYKYKIKPLVLEVDAPPARNDQNNNSFLLTIGPMLTMSMTSLVMGYTAINNVLNNGATWKSAVPSLVICVAMFSSVFLWPFISKIIDKKNKNKQEIKRQERYRKYIDNKKSIIKKEIAEQSSILRNNHPFIQDMEGIILVKQNTLWQKRIEDEDFLNISIGEGDFPMYIDIRYPEEHFTMVDDDLKDIVNELGNEPKILHNVPIEFSFLDTYIGGLIGYEELTSDYMKRMLLEVLAFHSYEDLNIIFLTDNEKQDNWNCFKDLSHLFNENKSLRFFATDNDEYKEVCYYLERIYNNRKENYNNDFNVHNTDKIYLIITDCFKKIRNFNLINSILNDKVNLGFSLFIIDEKSEHLPDQCSKFIHITKERGVLTSTYDNNKTIEFKMDFGININFEKCFNILSNIPILMISKDEGQLPNKIGFLEMYDVGKVEQLNSLDRWKKSNPILNLGAPIGTGKNGEKVIIDLHEKYHGPHGLVAGMTGSGKSELLITYILSMAINYHPYEVQFILIDYKGGGLAGAFENNALGVKLPHLVGCITNLDVNEIKRSLSSIESELKRRQALFNEARELSDDSTIDIYKYQKLYRDRIVKEPISHLFIISDEFAELKVQQPEFMDQLISTARIGRSLGVHLILATQKPSGIVDPQIWSNTRFRICLKVQDTSDSNDVIKSKDAAYIKNTGRFYFQVGFNEVFTLGQAAYAGGKYIPSENVSKTIDSSINFIDNIGFNIKSVETKEKTDVVLATNGVELFNIVKYLYNTANSQQIVCKPLWLSRIPEFIKPEDLAKKYNYEIEKFNINPIVGEYDVPTKQQQRLLTLPISKNGNALIYGANGSGKENFIVTLVYSSMLYYSPAEVNYYIIDFGAESLGMFKDSPIVGDVITISNEEKLINLFKMIYSTIEERKTLFYDYNGNYETFNKNSGQTISSIVVVINNYEAFSESYPNLDEDLISLSRDANKYGLYFVITVSSASGMRFKLKQNFSTIYCLTQNNEDDYSLIFGNVQKTYPSKIFGRGIIKEGSIYEFQTALVCERDNINKFIKDKCVEYSKKYNIKALPIPELPKKIGFNSIKDEFGKSDSLIIGIDKNNLEICKFNFVKNFITFITGLDSSQTSDLVNPLINQILLLQKYNLVFVNADEYDVDSYSKKYISYFDSKFDDCFNRLYNYVDEKYKLYEENNFDRNIFKNEKKTYCIISQINLFKMKLNNDNKLRFDDLFKKGKDLNLISFIIIDSSDKVKKLEYEPWYKECVNNDSAIWVGNGINDQLCIKMSQKIDNMKQKVPLGFCFIINKGRVRFVKYVEQLDIRKDES